MTFPMAPQLIAAGGFIALAFFIPALCLISVLIKRRSRDEKLSIIDRFNLKQSLYYEIYSTSGERSIVWATSIQIAIILVISIYFSTLLIYTPDVVDPAQMKNFLLLGPNLTPPDAELGNRLRESLYVMSYAFLGWYVWTISTIFSRLVTLELVPATYSNILMRLVVAVFVALVFYRLGGQLSTTLQDASAEAIGFGIGLFPDSALAWLGDRLRNSLLGTGAGVEELPLDVIQGISPFRDLRLFEMGLDNCQNLAAANAIELYLQSNLTLIEVIDWIAQAQLAILVRSENFKKLQRNGYRNVADFERACRSESARRVLSEITGFKDAQLIDLAEGMQSSPSFLRMNQLRDLVGATAVAERHTSGHIPVRAAGD